MRGWIDQIRKKSDAPAAVLLAAAQGEKVLLVGGLSKAEYAARWDESFDEVYGITTAQLVAGGMLEVSGDRVRLAADARFLSDAVFSEFAPGNSPA